MHSVVLSLGDSTHFTIVASTRDVVTSTLEQYPLFQLPLFKNLRFALYNILLSKLFFENIFLTQGEMYQVLMITTIKEMKWVY